MAHPRFDELQVPAPPYRMARPVATLAAAQPPGGPLNVSIGDRVKDQLTQERLEKLSAEKESPAKEAPRNPEKEMAEALVEAGLVVRETRERVAGKDGQNLKESPEGQALLSEASKAIEITEGLVQKHTKTGAASSKPVPKPSVQAPQTPTSTEQKALTTLEEERASVEKSKGVSDAERASRLAEYDKAIKERDAKIAAEKAAADTAAAEESAKKAPDERTPGELSPDVLDTLEKERASVAQSKGVSDAERARRLEEYDKAIRERDAKAAETQPVKSAVTEGVAPAPEQKPATEETKSQAPVEKKKPVLSKAEQKKLAEVGQLRELSNLQTEQRRLESLAQEAKAAGDTQKEQVLVRGIVELGQRIAAQREKIQGKQSSEQMAQKEMDYAHKAATVEGYERAQAKAEQQKAEQAGDRRVFDMARRVALESSVKDVANRYNDRGALSAQEWARYKELALEEATIREEDKAVSALQNLGRVGLQRRLLSPAEAQELATLRQRLEQGQAARGEQMHAEEEAHTEAAQEHAGRMIPRPERMNVRGYLGEMLRFVTERTGNPKTWWKTFERRMDIIEARKRALHDGEQQLRAQEKLNEANAEVQKYQQLLRGAGMMDKLWNGNRLRKWQKRANQLEAQVDTMNARRERYTARHNALQQEVIRVYESRLAPYREQVADLSRRHGEQTKVRETLLARLAEAQERMDRAEQESGRSRWLRSPRANRCINRIKDEMKEISQRIRASDDLQYKIDGQLSEAAQEIAKWEAKQKTAAQEMQLPELANLTARKREAPVPMREVGGVNVTPGPRMGRQPERVAPENGAPAPESVPAAPERDPARLEWKVADFIEQWNNNGLQRIEDQKAFTDYVDFERRRLKEAGAPTGQRLIELLRPYTMRASVKPDMKQFDRDVRFFFSNVRPRT